MVRDIAMVCVLLHAAPINMSEDLCVIHNGYSTCYPIVDAMHFDFDNTIVFNENLRNVLS